MDPSAYKLCDWIGYMTRSEVDMLQRLARSLPDNPVAINIGAGVGTSGMALFESREDITLYTIDVNDYPNPYGGLVNEREAFHHAGIYFNDRWIQLHGDSKVIGAEWDKGQVDLVFVDGDHVEEQVDGDIRSWIPHIKDGGIIAFHDYFTVYHLWVPEVVKRYFDPEKAIDKVDSMIAFRVKHG